jgi:hypothetical protein
MIHPRHARLLGFAALGLGLANPGFAQEPAKDKRDQAKEEPEIQIELPQITPETDDQQEMVRLFHEVELTLGSIDVELADASAGRIPLPQGQESGIDRLLRSNGAKSDQAVGGIEKILELAQKMGGGGT